MLSFFFPSKCFLVEDTDHEMMACDARLTINHYSDNAALSVEENVV